MGNLFNLAEVVDLGIEKEKKRRDFYAYVAKQFKEKEMQELFLRLKDWEELHIKKVSELRKDIQDQEVTESYEGELGAYMQALVDDQLYNEVLPKKFAQTVKTPHSAIRYGIGFEKDAILFFSGLLRYFISSHKEIIQKLIDEERQHIIYLYQLKNKLKEE